MDCNPPGSSVHGISQARVLAWVAISFSRASSQSRDWTYICCIGRQILYHWAPRGAPLYTIYKIHIHRHFILIIFIFHFILMHIYTHTYICHILFIHSSANEHLGWLLWAMMLWRWMNRHLIPEIFYFSTSLHLNSFLASFLLTRLITRPGSFFSSNAFFRIVLGSEGWGFL